MSVLNKIAFYPNRRDEVPNQQLARELAETENRNDHSTASKTTENRKKSKLSMTAPFAMDCNQ